MKIIKSFTIVGLLSMLILSSCGLTGPKPCFEMSCESLRQSDQILMGEEVFFGNCSDDGMSYSWDFGDGSKSSVNSPRHAYAQPGNYSVTLMVDNEKKTKSITKDITVEKSVFGSWSGTIKDGQEEYAFSMVLEQSATKISGTFNYSELGRSGILSTNCKIEDQLVSINTVISYETRRGTYSVLFKFVGEVDENLDSMSGGEISVGDEIYDSWQATRN